MSNPGPKGPLVYIEVYAYAIIVHTRADQLEEVWFKKIIFDKMTALRTYTIFPYMAFVYAQIVPSWADQRLPQLLMEQFDTLPMQCRHIEHMHEGVWFKKD